MKLSVIVPVYNVEKYIGYCLDSLLSQDIGKEDYEVIIINDGSTDDSASIAAKYAENHEIFKLISQTNKGVGVARNTGLEHANGEYIYFLDPDDYLASNSLNVLLSYIEKNDVEVLGFESKSTQEYDLLESETPFPTNFEIDVSDGITFIAQNRFMNEVWWYVVRRDFLIRTNLKFIKGRWMEDAIFTATMLLQSKKIGFVFHDIHRHVKVPNSAMTSKEPSHYRKVIYDNENAAVQYNSLIEMVNLKHHFFSQCIKRLKIRQESFVFFLIVRSYKSDLSLGELRDIINRLKEISIYPMKFFPGNDYLGFVFKILKLIFNKKSLLYFSFKMYRSIK